MEKFFKNHIIAQYMVPHAIISNNGKNFTVRKIEEYLQKYKIIYHRSSPYRLQLNGAVELANMNLVKILKKMAKTHKHWHEKLQYAQWAYRTSVRTSTGATPYSLE